MDWLDDLSIGQLLVLGMVAGPALGVATFFLGQFVFGGYLILLGLRDRFGCNDPS